MRDEDDRRAEAATLNQQHAAERKAEHEAYLASQEAYRLSLAPKPNVRPRIDSVFVSLLLYSAFVSTVLLVWLVFR
jgi:hypothetical protein